MDRSSSALSFYYPNTSVFSIAVVHLQLYRRKRRNFYIFSRPQCGGLLIVHQVNPRVTLPFWQTRHLLKNAPFLIPEPHFYFVFEEMKFLLRVFCLRNIYGSSPH